MASLLIGAVAERTGLTAPTIRYYESIGLVKPPVDAALAQVLTQTPQN